MSAQTIRFTSRVVAEALDYHAAIARISIGDPVQREPKWFGTPGAALRLAFLDVHPDDLPPFSPHFAFCFCEADAQAVVEFVRELPADIEEIIVHCEAGVSRSAAIALYIHAATGAQFPQQDLADLANLHVVSVFEDISGLSIPIPPSPSSQFMEFFSSGIEMDHIKP